MLTNLNWLTPGSTYPPPAEKDRLERYKQNEMLFLSEHTEAFKEVFEQASRRLRKRNFEVETIINYQQLLSKKTADFICGEPPELETEQDTDELDRLLERLRWAIRLYEAFIDVSRYGNAVLKLVGRRLTAVSPKYWFPIVDSTDVKTIKQHVVAYPTTPNDKGEMTELYAEIHDIGRVETRVYAYNAERLEIGMLYSASTAQTGIDDFAVQILTNVTHSSDVFGVDDYVIINSIVSKIMWRLCCIDRVLDKHSDPSVSGPASALEKDERTGLWLISMGNYFKRNDANDPELKYVTWDGNLESSFKEIEMLLNQLYTLSEMGQAFMEDAKGGSSSGTALKLRMVSPRIKAARLAHLNAATVKQIIYLLAQVNGIPLDYNGLTIHWNDGLPDDEVEQTKMLITATGSKPIMSQYSAMKRLGLSDGEVEAELEQMREEQAASMPAVLGVVDQNEGEPGTDEDTGDGG